jgi:hypothetical protein
MNIRRSLIGMAVSVLAVTGLLAIGAGPASAALTKLCGAAEETCAPINVKPALQEVKSEATDTKIWLEPIIEGKFVFIEITCGKAVLNFRTNAKEGNPLNVTPLATSFATCSSKQAETCTVSPEPWTGFLSHLGGLNAQFETTVQLNLACAKPKFECRYGGGEAMKAFGGNPAAIQVNKNMTWIAGAKETCPSLANWTAKYVVSFPKPLYFTK